MAMKFSVTGNLSIFSFVSVAYTHVLRGNKEGQNSGFKPSIPVHFRNLH